MPAPISLKPLRCSALLLANQASVIMMCTLKPFLAVSRECPSVQFIWPSTNDPARSTALNRPWGPHRRWPCCRSAFASPKGTWIRYDI
ncbi:hypothetical protein D9M68_919990 [compost metagenome]